MSKKRQATRATARPAGKESTRRGGRSSSQSRRPRRRAMAALALIIASIAATGIVAAQGGLGALVGAPAALRKLASGKASGSGATSGGASRAMSKSATPVQSPTPPPLTKEYIYAGHQMVATVEPTPTGPAPHIGSINPISGDPGQDMDGFTITGSHLLAVNRIASDNSLLNGFVTSQPSDSSVTARLEIGQQCPPGPHQIWVVTSGGQPSDNAATF